jgi:hypothetical protein
MIGHVVDAGIRRNQFSALFNADPTRERVRLG